MVDRIDGLEREVEALRAELAASRPGPTPVASSPAFAASPSLALTAPAAPAPQPERAAGHSSPFAFHIGATSVRLTGFIKVQATEEKFSHGSPANSSFGRDFYFNQQIPVTGRSQGALFDANAKQTRLGLTTTTPFGDQEVTTLFEGDFLVAPGTQGSQRTTNGYNFALRRAYIKYGGILVGQDWTTFVFTPAHPESTDYNGALDATVFVRQALVRYTRKLSPALEASVALENSETVSSTKTSGALIENGTDRLPDLAADIRYKAGKSEIQLAGLLRRLTVNNGRYGANATGWGLSLAGFVPYGRNRWNDIRFMATYGSGIGRYVGLNYAPDAIYGGLKGDPLQTVDVAAAFVAVRHGWSESLRSTLILGYQRDDYPSGVTGIDFNKRAWSTAINFFYSPVEKLDFGIEYRHASHEVLTGQRGTLNRTEFAAKFSF